jgi:hypothetical protein
MRPRIMCEKVISYMTKNITIALDEKVISAGRAYAQKHNTSLNSLIRQLLEQTVLPDSDQWLYECFALMDQAAANSQSGKWSRDELDRV